MSPVLVVPPAATQYPAAQQETVSNGGAPEGTLSLDQL
jgi:hypothetical protein